MMENKIRIDGKNDCKLNSNLNTTLYLKNYDHQRIVKISTCTLNQWAMDFEGNKNRIIKSILQSKEMGCKIRIGPELEITGYGCEDHFLELDTVNHSWEVLAQIISFKLGKNVNNESNLISDNSRDQYLTEDILCDIGMPVVHNGVIYNCRVLVYNSQILLIRPKIAMADDGNYRENRWFTPWSKGYVLEEFILPECISNLTNQKETKFGIGFIKSLDLSYAPEICEELWIPYSPSIDLSMSGCEIIGNSSGSYFQINKQERRFELIVNASKKNGGVYVYSNLTGCDGGRLYFDGGSFVSINGKILAEGSRFSLNEIEIVTAVVDLNEVCSYRNSIKSRCSQSAQNELTVPSVHINEFILKNKSSENLYKDKFNPFSSIRPKFYTYEEEMSYAPACWMWDYLRRSGASGFFLALSGGADSSCVSVMVSLLTRMIYQEISGKNEFVLSELRKILKQDDYFPKSAEEICNLMFVTAYMGTKYSSSETRKNSAQLSQEIGAYHLNVNIDKIFEAIKETFIDNLGKEFEPKFISEGGSWEQDISLQNIQARVRMVLSYMLAGLVSWTRKRKGFLLVLASGNLDEGITGYLTKYDCSSADINPIGSISKVRLKAFLHYCYKYKNYPSLEGVLKIAPSAELRPTETGKKPQTDEEDLGITYEELSLLGQLRKDYRCGPYTMFRRLQSIWKDRSTSEILVKVKLFFRKYAINRHKMTTITPALHCESYSLDDNRFDLRQFLYNSYWTFQFNTLDKFVESEKGFGTQGNVISI